VRGRVRIGRAAHDLRGAALAGLVEQVLQREVLARARLERLLVGAEHRAEAEVDERRLRAVGGPVPADQARGVEDILEVVALARVDDIDDEVAVELVGAEAHGREIGGSVEEPAVRLLDEQRALTVGEGHDHRALVALREPRLRERIDHAAEPVAEEALAAVVLGADLHVQRARGLVDLLHRDFDQALPQSHDLCVARLQADERLLRVLHRAARGLVLDLELGDPVRSAPELVRGIEIRRRGLFLRAAVGGVEVVEGELREVGLLADELRERHRDGKSPVAEVVLAPDLPAEALEHARERVADDRRAQVADMHLLGDIHAAPAWPKYELPGRVTMQWNTVSKATPDPRGEERRLVGLIPYRQPGT